MIQISPITNSYTFKKAETRQYPASYNKYDDSEKLYAKAGAVIGAAGLILGGSALFILSKGKASMMSYENALKKQGVKIKDGMAIIEATGEKFTGKIKRNLNLNKKEIVKFNDGNMTEKLYYNALGKELSGEFYKNGKLNIKVSEHSGMFYKHFYYVQYENGKLKARGDAMLSQFGDSVFEWARKFSKV